MTTAVFFDQVPGRLREFTERFGADLAPAAPIVFVRDLWGRVRAVVTQRPPKNSKDHATLNRFVTALAETLGAHGVPPEQALLARNELLDPGAVTDAPGALTWQVGAVAYSLIDRQLSALSWAQVVDLPPPGAAPRLTFFGLKGGVGRSTAAAVAARHIAAAGFTVLVVDLDLEAPGLSTSLLPDDARPDFGVVDWLVEDLVGQGELLVPDMVASSPLGAGLTGQILVVPCHGRDPGDYLAKLGRASMAPAGGTWSARLERLLRALEQRHRPDVVLLDSRAGLHDHASTLVTDLGADVLLFAIGTEQTWSDYRILFKHWLTRGASRAVRERLHFVAAQVPETDRPAVLATFRQKAWDLFSEYLYDAAAEGELGDFTFDLADPDAPHAPTPIFWNRGMASLASLDAVDPQLVEANYSKFLALIERSLPFWPQGDPS